MIKRLFRSWLRYKLVKLVGEKELNFEEVFEWIYNSLIWEWNIRLYLANRFDGIDTETCKFKVDISKAQDVLNLIKK